MNKEEKEQYDLKSIENKYKKDGKPFNNIWNELINNGDLVNYTNKAKNIIEHFLKDIKPKWLIYCPF